MILLLKVPRLTTNGEEFCISFMDLHAQFQARMERNKFNVRGNMKPSLRAPDSALEIKPGFP